VVHTPLIFSFSQSTSPCRTAHAGGEPRQKQARPHQVPQHPQRQQQRSRTQGLPSEAVCAKSARARGGGGGQSGWMSPGPARAQRGREARAAPTSQPWDARPLSTSSARDRPARAALRSTHSTQGAPPAQSSRAQRRRSRAGVRSRMQSSNEPPKLAASPPRSVGRARGWVRTHGGRWWRLACARAHARAECTHPLHAHTRGEPPLTTRCARARTRGMYTPSPCPHTRATPFTTRCARARTRGMYTPSPCPHTRGTPFTTRTGPWPSPPLPAGWCAWCRRRPAPALPRLRCGPAWPCRRRSPGSPPGP
jgi:hypothetical protein